MTKWRFLLSQLTDRLWLRAAIYAVVGIGVALLAAIFSPFVPQSLAKPFGGGTVTGLLDVLSSSLLAVATFSVTAMLTAFTNISQSTTPRAATLVSSNRAAQGALSTFVGAFLYSVVGYSALGTGYYGPGGHAILFFVTLIVLALVAVTLLRWLDQLLRLARVDEAITAVERETAAAMRGLFGAPSSGATPPAVPAGAATVTAGEVGYVQNVDVKALRRLAAGSDLRIWLRSLPGAFTVPGSVLAALDGATDAATLEEVRAAFTLGPDRSFAQDPQFGLIVLGEIASKALSPGINNPGMAKDVITSVVRLLVDWMARQREASRPVEERLFWRGPELGDLLEDALLSVTKDGAASVTVAVRLQNVLAAMGEGAGADHRRVIAAFSREALQRSESGLEHEPDRVRVRNATGRFADAP